MLKSTLETANRFPERETLKKTLTKKISNIFIVPKNSKGDSLGSEPKNSKKLKRVLFDVITILSKKCRTGLEKSKGDPSVSFTLKKSEKVLRPGIRTHAHFTGTHSSTTTNCRTGATLVLSVINFT